MSTLHRLREGTRTGSQRSLDLCAWAQLDGGEDGGSEDTCSLPAEWKSSVSGRGNKAQPGGTARCSKGARGHPDGSRARGVGEVRPSGPGAGSFKAMQGSLSVYLLLSPWVHSPALSQSRPLVVHTCRAALGQEQVTCLSKTFARVSGHVRL